MKIDGKAIAEKMLAELAGQVAELKKRGITPTLAVILVGDNPASLSYIKQKRIAAEKIGAKLILNQLPVTTSYHQLRYIIEQYNHDPNIHGIIIQRPLPEAQPLTTTLQCVVVTKDVDGFVKNSPFEVPVASAVLTILDFIRSHPAAGGRVRPLQKSDIVVIGRGETAGKPIADALIKHRCKVAVVHSQTASPDEVIRSGDIVISCVGKANVVRRDSIKSGATLISVGLWRDRKGKLRGDYDEEEIAQVAGFYTPTPGGVGPLNVACLMKNLVIASQESH